MAVERLSRDLFPAPDAVRERLSQNLVENRYLKRLLRVAEDAANERNVGRFAPDASAPLPMSSPRRGA
jgi:hypothetical protein